MAKASEIIEEVTVSYASHELEPLEKLDFIHLPKFERGWKQHKLTDDDMKALRTMLTAAPTMAPVMKGTGGLRKLRFQDPRSNRGKSGGYRVCYAFFEDFGIALLVQIYPKNKKNSLTALERGQIKEQLTEFQQLLNQKPLS